MVLHKRDGKAINHRKHLTFFILFNKYGVSNTVIDTDNDLLKTNATPKKLVIVNVDILDKTKEKL